MMRSKRAFSVVELVVVVGILLLLSGVLIPVVGGEMHKAMVGKATTDMKKLAEAYNRYFIHTGHWPTASKTENFAAKSNFEFTAMDCLYTNAHERKSWGGPYLGAGILSDGAWRIAEAGPSGWTGFVDPWGNPFRMYHFPKGQEMGPFGGIAIMSFGKDGASNSTDAQIGAGTPGGDDLVVVITHSL
jgi:type II secretory pathway pseudopilin PulG